MKRWLSLALLCGALLGLMGQETAFARVMPVAKLEQVAAAAQMSPECAEMMGLAKPQPQPEKHPCQGMTPDCIAKMGCAVSLALIPPLTVAMLGEHRASTPPRMPVARLVGRDTGPELEPPALLG